MELEELKNAVQAAYNAIWDIWYQGQADITKATVTVEMNCQDSGYERIKDIIFIRFPEGNLDEFSPLDDGRPFENRVGQQWQAWQMHLVHEMLHEYQEKVRFEPTDEGRVLFSRFQVTESRPRAFNNTDGPSGMGFSGPGHDERFYTAITIHASSFNLDSNGLKGNI